MARRCVKSSAREARLTEMTSVIKNENFCYYHIIIYRFDFFIIFFFFLTDLVFSDLAEKYMHDLVFSV